mgnify:CR=1 FL=1
MPVPGPLASMQPMGLSLALVVVALAVALALRPWRALSADGVLQPWLACLVLLPWLWAAQRVMPGGVAVQLSGACLLVLLVGWPLAVLSLVPIAALGAWLGGIAWPQALDHLAWNGIVTATLEGRSLREARAQAAYHTLQRAGR